MLESQEVIQQADKSARMPKVIQESLLVRRIEPMDQPKAEVIWENMVNPTSELEGRPKSQLVEAYAMRIRTRSWRIIIPSTRTSNIVHHPQADRNAWL
ncbi:MAG: hypothetical protein Q9219_007238 [cf. Caloplaca sp. 3 TL-2023]